MSGDERRKRQTGFGASFYFGFGLPCLSRFEGGDVQVFRTGREVDFHEDVAGLNHESVIVIVSLVDTWGVENQEDILLRVVVLALLMK